MLESAEVGHAISKASYAQQEPKLRELCRDLLSNPVIEDYRLEMPEAAK